MKANNSTATFTAANTYSGSTSLAAGILALAGGDNRLPTATSLILPSTFSFATLNVGATNQTVASIVVGPVADRMPPGTSVAVGVPESQT